MGNLKRSGLVALQLLVAVATVVATIIMLLHPACIEHMLAEVARGVAAGLLFAGVKVLAKISRHNMACKALSCWSCYAWVVARHEFRSGLIGGYLLGLGVAMWACWNG